MNRMSYVSLQHVDALVIMWLDNPPANYFSLELITELADAYGDVHKRPEARAIVLATRGKHFCAGADFSRASPDPEAALRLYEQAVRLFEAPLPVIAAVQGGAIGGGLGLALSTDFRVATPETWFAANFSQLGFTPGFGLTVTMPQIVGRQRAAELMLTGRRFYATEAERFGLVDRVAQDNNLLATACAFANEVAASAPLAVTSLLRTIRGARAQEVREAMRVEVSEQTRLRETADFAEGVAAARERRAPRFVGR
jgi:enoyl-CoA hydratase/carnithine racemase